MPGPHRIHPREGGPAGPEPPASEPSATRPPTKPDGGPGDGDRGQTTLDFAIGIVIFLAVILFVFAFVPGILEPFNLAGEQDTVRSERIASHLSQGALGDPARPYIIESDCTKEFFEDDAVPSRCHFEGDDLSERLHVPSYRNVNVTIEGDFGTGSEVACLQVDGDQELVGGESGPCNHDGGPDQLLAIGPDRPTLGSSTVTSRRVVSLHQRNVTMKVMVW